MNVIYTFWTGTNPISENRKKSLKQLEALSSTKVILVTPENLNDYILPTEPLHPAYKYLSAVHKADYLRTYFMNFHGGGYSDIKQTTGSWTPCFTELEAADKWINGYKELENGVAYAPAAAYWQQMVGNCAYICKPQTPLTQEWYAEMISLLDSKLEMLEKHPARIPRDCFEAGNQYPIEWNEMLGRIFHKLCYKYKDMLLNTLPPCIFANYQ